MAIPLAERPTELDKQDGDNEAKTGNRYRYRGDTCSAYTVRVWRDRKYQMFRLDRLYVCVCARARACIY